MCSTAFVTVVEAEEQRVSVDAVVAASVAVVAVRRGSTHRASPTTNPLDRHK